MRDPAEPCVRMAGRLGTSGRAAQCAGDESGERNKHGRAWAQPAVDADAGWGLWFRKSGGSRGESGDPALFRTRASRFTVHVDPFSFSSSDPAYGRPYRVPACTASSLLPARRPRFLQPAVDRFSLRFIQSIFGTGVGLAVINISISLFERSAASIALGRRRAGPVPGAHRVCYS